MKPFKKSIYLAGAISYFYNTDQSERATKWRDKAEEYFEQFDVKCFNPCKENPCCWDYPQDGLIKQNYFYLKNCDAMLLNLDMLNDSIGTVFEMTLFWEWHKPIIAFGKTPWLERPHCKSMIDVHFNTLDEALDYIANMFEI